MIAQREAARRDNRTAPQNPIETCHQNPSILADLIAIEPRIARLIADASRPVGLCEECRRQQLKPLLEHLVGFHSAATDPRLRTAVTFERVYGVLLRSIPVSTVCCSCGVEEGGKR